jgi:hypothetical protein
VTATVPPAVVTVERIDEVPQTTGPPSYEFRVKTTARRDIHVDDIRLEWMGDSSVCETSFARNGAFLRAGETDHSEMKRRLDVLSSPAWGALDVTLSEPDRTWCVRFPLSRPAGEGSFVASPPPITVRYTFAFHAFAKTTSGISSLFTLAGIGAARAVGRLRMGMTADVALAVCDEIVCRTEHKAGPSSTFGGGLTGFVGGATVPLGSHLLGAELRYFAYLLSQPLIGGNEALWLHGPAIAPYLLVRLPQSHFSEIGLDPGSRGIAIGIPAGLVWGTGPGTNPGVSVGVFLAIQN